MECTQKNVTARDVGLLVLRLTIAIVFLHAGGMKAFGGLAGFEQALTHMNVPMPHVSARLAAYTEFFGGAAMLLGVLTRLVALPMIFTMLVAINVTRANGFSIMAKGFEFPLVMGMILLAVALTGPGALSVDGWICRKWRSRRDGRMATTA